MNTTAPKPKTRKPKAPAVTSWTPYHTDPYRPANVNHPDPDFAPARVMRPPVPPFDTTAEIRAMAERLRWLSARDNDAGRLACEQLGEWLGFDELCEVNEDLQKEAGGAEKRAIEADELVDELRDHIDKMIEMIADLSDALTPDEQDEPENVSAFMDGYTRRLTAWEQYLTDNMLRQ